MRAEYDSAATVRRARRLGWGLTGVILLGVALTLGWRILQVSEARALDAMRENLAASLNSLAAEGVAQRRPPAAVWLTLNPFVLLRWQPDSYCGELAEGQAPRPGCWHFLPRQAWVLYRARFAGARAEMVEQTLAWRLRLLPEPMRAGTGQAEPPLTVELQPVPAAELRNSLFAG
ncbi:hypothetical protein [Pseudomonas sp. 2FG]|uniref:hypothetical protein n=1 Tax=Pseudomonas sp. 2FG TaxID=2502191 RepID=UPI0010F9D2D8|nr:hypothetical protein [Pseudomonas sp. 2FG]